MKTFPSGMELRTFQGDCVRNPFETTEELTEVIDRAKEIKKINFFKKCAVNQEIMDSMNKFPRDYVFYKSREIYFYTWSAIEYFYF